MTKSNLLANLHYIDQDHALAEICDRLQQQPWIAVDTEFVRTDTYYPKLSLVQIFDLQNQQAILVDPLALNDLDPLWSLLSNPQVCKVFHSARQDIEVLYQVSHQLPQNLFDTQLAALFLGYGDSISFAKLVEAELDIRLAKSQTRTNWHQRPLSADQLQYAADDVIYLAPLYEKMRPRLTSEQLTAVEEDIQALLTPALYQIDPSKAGEKLLENRHFSPKQQAIILALASWREHHAQSHDRPRRWVLKDETIMDLAKRPPKAIEALYKLPQIKHSDLKTYGETWIDLIDDVFAHPETWPEKMPKTPALTPQASVFYQLLQAWVQQISVDYHIPLNRILPKKQAIALIQRLMEAPNQPTPLLSGWRHLLIEQPFQQFFLQKTTLTAQQNHLTFK